MNIGNIFYNVYLLIKEFNTFNDQKNDYKKYNFIAKRTSEYSKII